MRKLSFTLREYPEVQELLKDNYSLSVALLAKRIEDRLALFDGNHTRAQAKLCDRMKQLEERVDDASKFAAGLRTRIKELESQNAATSEKLEPTKEPAEATP